MRCALSLLLSLCFISSAVSSTSNSNRSNPYNKRYNSNFNPPQNYRFSWGQDGSRLSYGSSTGQYLDRSTLSSQTLNQDQIDECASLCEAEKGCGFFHPIENKSGNVVCALYGGKVSKSETSFDKGGVKSSYGFTRNEGPSDGNGGSGSGSNDDDSCSTCPPGPDRATLVQFKPCSNSILTVPMFVNPAWAFNNKPSTSTHAFIVQHGLARDMDRAYSDVINLIGEKRVLVSGGFYLPSDSGQNNFYQATKNLAWQDTNSWIGGSNSVAGSCSTYDYYDALIKVFSDKSIYPNMEKISIIGHSDGGSTVARYALVSDDPPLPIRYVAANSPTNPYLNTIRPRTSKSLDKGSCSNYNNWMYGPQNRPSYVDSHWTNDEAMFKRYASRDVVTLIGTDDTYASSHFGDQSCEAQAQGGENRRDRNYAYWAYKNMLSGSSNNVSNFYGYTTLKNNGLKSINSGGSFNHRNCVVKGIGHNANAMFNSDCGRNALFSNYVGEGDAPSRD